MDGPPQAAGATPIAGTTAPAAESVPRPSMPGLVSRCGQHLRRAMHLAPKSPAGPPRPELGNIRHVDTDIAMPRIQNAIRLFLKVPHKEAASPRFENGICLGTSIEWILAVHRSGGKASPCVPGGPLSQPSTIEKAFDTQDLYDRIAAEVSAEAREDWTSQDRAARVDQRVLAEKGLKSTLLCQGAVDHDVAAKHVAKPGTYMIMWSYMGDGHACVVRNTASFGRRPSFTVFDSNVGECVVKPRDLVYLLDALKAAYYHRGCDFFSMHVHSIDGIEGA